jgi:hypothetical protein
MHQDMAGHECSRESSETREETGRGRVLTYDETKAAEAAFRGEPFNPAWSTAAAQVYAGILAAMSKGESTPPTEGEAACDRDYIRC